MAPHVYASSPKYYKSLDGVRGVAALMIMFLHFMPGYDKAHHPILYLLKKLSIVGQCGVMLFFVLSGFLITRILLNNKLNNDYFSAFYIKRALRIFPLYYLFLIINFFVIPAINKVSPPSFDLTWYYYFYLQNIAMTFNWKAADIPHLWSLAVEEHFYLFWPVIVYFFSDKSLKHIIFGCVVIAFLCRVVLIYNGIGTYYFTFTTFDCLALGGLLALNEKHKWYTDKGMMRLFFFTAIPLFITWPFVTGLHNDYVQYLKVLLISLVCMGLIGLLTLKNTFLDKFFSSHFLRFTGKISYGLYVFHPLCFGICTRFFHTDIFISNIILGFSLSYAIAALSYYGYELHFLKLKNKL